MSSDKVSIDKILSVVNEKKCVQYELSEDDLNLLRKYLISNKAQDLVQKTNGLYIIQFFYKPVFTSTINSSGLGSYRTVASDTLGIWLQRAVQCTSLSEEATTCIKSLVSDSDLDAIFDFVCDFWADSGAALSNSLKELFLKTMSLVQRIRTPEQRIEILRSWTNRVLKFSRTMRVLYFALEILAKQVGGDYILAQAPYLPKEILSLIGGNALANPIGKTLSSIYTSIRKSMKESGEYKTEIELDQSWVKVWSNLVYDALTKAQLRRHTQTYLLPQLFKLSSNAFKIFIKPLIAVSNSTSEDDIESLIGCLKIGQNLSILDISDDDSVISEDFLKALLHHSSTSLRTGGLSLVVASPQGLRPIPSYAFEALKGCMDDLFAESDAEFRNQVYGFMRQFTARVRDCAYGMNRDFKKLTKSGMSEEAAKILPKIEEIKCFMQWLVNYLEKQLFPGSNYQNMHNSLRILPMLIRSGLDSRVHKEYHEKQHLDYPFDIKVYSDTLIRLLVDNITNNFEDVRQSSVAVLKMCPVPVSHLRTLEDVDSLAAKGLDMISGMRGREGDGGARVIEFAFDLYRKFSVGREIQFLDNIMDLVEKCVKLGQDDLAVAVREHSIHGYFNTLRLIFETIDFSTYVSKDSASERDEWRTRIQRLTACIFNVWDIVKDILCHDSPEGNMPEELESNYQPELEARYGPATQVILSYSWRAVKESTALLGTILTRVPIDPKINLLPNDLVIKCGEVILNQLATVRHRGAFSSVFPTFIACCNRCNQSESPLDTQSERWLYMNLEVIQTKAQFITRRSGGLPFLITAVLTCETNSERPLLKSTFKTLLEIACRPVTFGSNTGDEKTELAQVHAFNCIRAIFIEAKLSGCSTFYTDQALALAISSFSSNVWAIRNCAVMLFTALQNRLFGTKKVSENRYTMGTMAARLFFSKYKAIRGIILGHLQEHVQHLDSEDTSHVETVYPVLSLLARLEGTHGYEGLNEFRPLIMQCLRSRIWKIREMAARTLPSLINDENLYSEAGIILTSASISGQNELHGALLAVFHIINRAREKLHENLPSTDVIDVLNQKFHELIVRNPSPQTALAAYRVYSQVYNYNFETNLSFYEKFINYSLNTFDASPDSAKLNASSRLFRQDIAELVLTYVFEHHRDETVTLKFVSKLLFDYADDVQLATIRYIEKCNTSGSLISSSMVKPICANLWKLFKTSTWDQVRGPAVRVFGELFNISINGTSFLSEVDETYWNTLYVSISSHSTEEINEAALEALGSLTAQSKNEVHINKWYNTMAMFSQEHQDFPTRLSALKSLTTFLSHFKLNEQANGTTTLFVLNPYFSLLKFLSDDDDELREFAAKFVSEILELQFSSTCTLCEKALLDAICKSFPKEAISPIMSIIKGDDSNGSLSNQLQASLIRDDLLFVIEKHNLFKNEVNQLDHLVQVLISAPILSQITLEDVTSFASYTQDGIISLKLALDGLGPDGLLGWSTNPNVFFSVFKIVASVKLLRQWNFAMDKGDTYSIIESIFKEISTTAKENELHEILTSAMSFSFS
ncbi:hypothetical protein NADFUDRAFT_51954 [Nadsonia fulvescens var. elongata DSM 6958]|uniref:Uncharacterized protein n=1 Tax=Nadsonia fulvescens var. elongata DSM 6958 TaxID=857566 RepID=A0A1E3PIW2_9ASCO|nr:hypothetical protein NADFUDRAFT_51954 [Nadsonia fulvescens var. elongata DSM 6958]